MRPPSGQRLWVSKLGVERTRFKFPSLNVYEQGLGKSFGLSESSL